MVPAPMQAEPLIWEGAPWDALELMNMGVQFLREHVVPEARIHYAITNTGGYSPNVVQPYAEVLYLIRAPEE